MNQKFEYKLTPILWTLFIAGLIAAGVCVYLNITRFIALLSAEDAGNADPPRDYLCNYAGLYGSSGPVLQYSFTFNDQKTFPERREVYRCCRKVTCCYRIDSNKQKGRIL